MSRALSPPEVEAVRRMLAVGARHTEIARALRLSVWTIARIADGRRRDPAAPADEASDDAPPGYLPQNLGRCPGCGAMVYLWPCLACRMGTTARPVASPDLPAAPPPVVA